MLLVGPYLVRTAALRGSTLSITGDLNATTTLQLFGPSSIKTVEWNGEEVKLGEHTAWGALQATLAGPRVKMELPSLRAAKWKYADSLPEITPTYDDSKWTKADLTNSTSLFPRYYGGPWNLSVASDYGYHVRFFPD